jgi:phosphoserine phosphatase RsbU/P
MSSTSPTEPDHHTLQCMEIWGGIEPVERTVTTPGLDAWIFSRPFEGDEQGGDVYYVTLCGGGLITRIVVADVSGHGASVAEFSLALRALVRRNINQKSQRRLVQQINRQFTEMADLRRFATAVVATYLASTNRISVCNAGHPRPLFRRAADGDWSLLTPTNEDDQGAGNLPLGLDEETRYQMFDVALEPGDLLVFYTDAFIEAADSDGNLLGESGLLNVMRGVDSSDRDPAAIGTALLKAVASYRRDRSADDDMTMIVVHHNAGDSPRLSLGQKLDVYAKVFGLKAV